jgi:acetylornithine deacetylase
LTVADQNAMNHHAAALDRDLAIARSVHELRTEMVAALQRLVRVPSQTGHEGEAQEIMAALMREQGLELDVWQPDLEQLAPYAESLTLSDGFAGRPNVVGRWRGAGTGRSLILNGHIDTVEVGLAEAWEHDPLGGAIADGRLYGRGACDMKAGLVASLFALRALRRAGFTPAGDVIVESTVSEEDGGAGALAAVLRGYAADAAVIAEPTDLTIVPAQGGSLMFRLQVPGLSAHACVRDEGVSAIENFSYLHCGLHGGTWPSSVPDLVVAEGRAGLVPGEELQSFKSHLAQEVLRLAAQHSWLAEHPPRLEWLEGQFAPADVPVDAPLVRTLGVAVERMTGTPPRIAAVTYGADMRHFVLTGGMPCVLFGAGDVRLAHAPNESIAIDDLVKAVTVLASFLAEWCGVATV